MNFSNIAEKIKRANPNDPGSWPPVLQFAVAVGVVLLVLFLVWYLDIRDLKTELDTLKSKEQELRISFETKQKKVANFGKLKKQLDEMQQSFGDMLRQLPDKAEVAGLLVDISQTGLSAGLEFELFEPKGEINKEFYVEIPIAIRVLGGYHQLAHFVSDLAALPRIVTVHNLKIKKKTSNASNLLMEATVKTYQSASEEDQEEGAEL